MQISPLCLEIGKTTALNDVNTLFGFILDLFKLVYIAVTHFLHALCAISCLPWHSPIPGQLKQTDAAHEDRCEPLLQDHKSTDDT